MANFVGRQTKRVSNMNARVPSSLTGLRSEVLARSKVSASGPWPDMQLWRLAPPGTKPSGLASYSPWMRPMNSFMKLRWNQGGRKVCSATIQRGGKTTKSALAVPGISLGEVRTVYMDGSGWSKLTELMQLKRARSY